MQEDSLLRRHLAVKVVIQHLKIAATQCFLYRRKILGHAVKAHSGSFQRFFPARTNALFACCDRFLAVQPSRFL